MLKILVTYYSRISALLNVKSSKLKKQPIIYLNNLFYLSTFFQLENNALKHNLISKQRKKNYVT